MLIVTRYITCIVLWFKQFMTIEFELKISYLITLLKGFYNLGWYINKYLHTLVLVFRPCN